MKLLTEFFKDKGLRDGHSNTCKACKQEATYAWREKNKDKYNAYTRQKNKERYPTARLQRYGLTPEQHAQMLLDQKSVCAICSKPPKGKRPLCVDHRHSDGKVRGLLCYGCNRALHVLESIELLESAMTYLAKYE